MYNNLFNYMYREWQAVDDVKLKITVEQSSVCIAPTHYDVLAGIDLLIALDALVCDVLVKK